MFETTEAKTSSVAQGLSVLNNIRAAYYQAKAVKQALDLFSAASDPVYNATINSMFTAAERAELAAVSAHFASLITELVRWSRFFDKKRSSFKVGFSLLNSLTIPVAHRTLKNSMIS